MAILRSDSTFSDTGFLRLPIGASAERPGNLISNGTFESTNNWFTNGSGTTTYSATNGKLVITRNGGLGSGEPYTIINTVAGTTYTLTVDIEGTPMGINIGTSIGGTQYFAQNIPVGAQNKRTFTATSSGVAYVLLICDSLGTTSRADNLEIRSNSISPSTAGAMRINSTTGLLETYDGVAWDSNVVAFPYRSIITTAFVQGGYKDAVAWNNVNKTFSATDTTINLGDGAIERSHNYQWGACSKDYSYVFGAGNAHAAASNYTIAFNMRTEQQVSDISRTLAGTRHTFGGVFQEHYYAWISGGDNARIEEYNMTTKTLVGTLTPTYASGAIWGMSHENIGLFYTSESASTWTFATRTIAARGGTAPSAHHQQKSVQSKHAIGFAGNEGTYNAGNNYRRTNMITNVTSGTVAKPVTNSGEENYTLGNDHQYMLGMYNGLQNNISARFSYATESGFQLGATSEPKGKGGMSSAVCGWCD